MNKRLFSLILAIIAIAMPAKLWAQEPYAALSESNTKLTFYYDDKKADRNGMDILPATSADMIPWFSESTNITKVVFDASFANDSTITSTAYWFFSLQKVTEIEGLQYLNTSKVTDMSYMFNSCSGLTSLDLSSFNTQNVSNMIYMFSQCTGLTNVNLSSFNTHNVTDMTCMFDFCSSLTSLDLSKFDTQNVKNMYYMFSNCSSLKTLDLSSFNTQNVTNMNGMFWGCSGLEILDLSSFNTQSVTNMAGMFYGCSALTKIYVGSNWSTSSVNNDVEMFKDCTSLVGGKGTVYDYFYTDATYAHIDGGTSNPGYLTDIATIGKQAYAVLSESNTKLTFYYDDKKADRNGMDINNSWAESSPYGMITTVVFDASFENYRPVSTAYWFANCSSLSTITGMENLNTVNVTDMSCMFSGCSSLTSLDVSEFNTTNVKNMFNMFLDCSSLTSLDVSKFNTSNVTDMYSLFFGCSNLTSLDVSGFNTDNVTNMSCMFNKCSSLTSLDVSGFKTENVVSMMEMFRDCSSLTSLDVSGFKTDNVTNMRCMFADCSSLTSVDVSSFNTANVTDMGSMFSGCSGLTDLDVSGFKTDNVTSMGNMFNHCSGLTGLDVSGFKTENVTDIEAMFYNCSGLTTLDISGFKTDNVTYMSVMFWGCSGLKTIYVGENWSTAKVEYGNDMFTGCTNLVGGKGTTYDADHTDYTYAHIDGGSSNPGYFTDIADKDDVNEAYVVMVSDSISGMSMTLYYDKNKNHHSEGFATVGLNELLENQAVLMNRSQVKKVIFGESFADCRPTSTAYWFSEFSSLETIEGIENLKTDSVTSMKSMFDHCSSLTSLDLSKFNTANVTDMYALFSGCSSLTSLDVSNINTAKVKDMIYMFSGCSGLTSLDLSNFNTANAEDMYCMFQNCSGLKSLDVRSFNTAKVTDIGGMFYGCSSLTSLDLSSFNTSQVIYDYDNGYLGISGMFQNCSGLTTIYVGDDWTTANLTESPDVFTGCTNLVGGKGTTYDADHTDYTYAHIDGGTDNPGYFTDKNAPVISDDIIQFADANVKSICVTNWDADGDGELSKTEAAAVSSIGTVFKENKTIGSFNELKYFTGLQSLSIGAFEESSVTSLELPDGLKEIGSDAFSQCRQLKSIYISATVSKMGSDSGMAEFWLCYNLETIIVDENNKFYTAVDNVLFNKEMTKIIRYPAAKTDVAYEIPNTVSIINQNCFEACSNLKAVYIPASVNEMGYGAFQQCDNLITVTISDGVTVIGEDAFRSCKSLAHIHIPASVKQIGRENRSPENAFFWSDALMEITVDENNPYFMSDGGILYSKDKSIIAAYPPALTASEFTVPYGVTKISSCCFTGTENLKSIHFPETVVAYDNAAINISNSTLQSLTVMATAPVAIEKNAFSTAVYSATLYVPSGTVEAYKNATGWKEFKSIVEMEPAIDYAFNSSTGVLTVWGETTMADALSAAGGKEEVAKTITAIVWGKSTPMTNDDLQGLDNPNMLVYVADASLAPVNRDNVVIGNDSTGYTAKNIVLKDVESGNGNFYCPQEFMAEMISYTRNFQQKTEVGVSRGWETIALPFDVQTITHEKYGTISPFGRNDGNKHFWLRQVTQQGLAQADKMQAYLPYLISMPNSESYSAAYNLAGRVTFSTQNVVVHETLPYGIQMQNEGGEMVTLWATFSGVSKSAGVYALNVGEARGNYPEGSVFEANYREVRPFEAYTRHEGNGPAPQFIPVAGFTDGETTGIEDVRDMMSDGRGEGAWYDLNGRKLQQKPTRKGVYLNNGQKVVIK